MRIAMIGQKGIPATWGGVERHVEEISRRLVQRGHEVTVYTRTHYTPPEITEYQGIRIVSLPTLHTKHLDAIVHCALASLHSWGGRYDVVHYHAIGPALTAPLTRIRGYGVVATIHGQDFQRAKWGRLASMMLKTGEWCALNVAHETISVSERLAEEYIHHGHESVRFIPNGVSVPEGEDTSILDELELTDTPYLLFAGRITPEKGAHYLLEAWRALGETIPLVIAGDASFTDEYVTSLRESAPESVRFPGYVYGERLAALFRHATLFVLPSNIEGQPIVLLEAAAYGTPVLASNIPQNVEVLGADGHYFVAGDVDSLTRELAKCLAIATKLKAEAEGHRAEALVRFDWDSVADRTIEVYEAVASRR